MAEIRACLALLAAAGCHTWRERPATAPAPTFVAQTLRVTTNRGARRLTFERATVRSDSVVGVLVEAEDRRGGDWKFDETTSRGQRVAVAAGDVWSLEERRLLIIGHASRRVIFPSRAPVRGNGVCPGPAVLARSSGTSRWAPTSSRATRIRGDMP